jgi:hypothetical protein
MIIVIPMTLMIAEYVMVAMLVWIVMERHLVLLIQMSVVFVLAVQPVMMHVFPIVMGPGVVLLIQIIVMIV